MKCKQLRFIHVFTRVLTCIIKIPASVVFLFVKFFVLIFDCGRNNKKNSDLVQFTRQMKIHIVIYPQQKSFIC